METKLLVEEALSFLQNELKTNVLDKTFISKWLTKYDHLWDESIMNDDLEENPDLTEISDRIAELGSALDLFDSNLTSCELFFDYLSLNINDEELLKKWMEIVYYKCSKFIHRKFSLDDVVLDANSLKIYDINYKFNELQYSFFLTQIYSKHLKYACEEDLENMRLIGLANFVI